MGHNLKKYPTKSCACCRLNESVYCRECYDFNLFYPLEKYVPLDNFFPEAP